MKRKRIWFDIGHLAQYNFYKQVIVQLSRGYDVYVTLLDRGSLCRIVSQEIGNIENVVISPVGKHCKTKTGIYLRTNIVRIIELIIYAKRIKPSTVLSNGFQTAFVSWVLGFPGIEFGDDVRGIDSKLKGKFSSYSQYCIPDVCLPGIKTIQCPKEWAYLAPRYFIPNQDVVSKYGLKPFKYVFVREVDTRTTNYSGQKQNAVLRANVEVPSDFQVIISLEIRDQRNLYPDKWLTIDQSEKDIHSLLYYSAATISSGDSMAREASALGVPSIYCGQRIMMANATFIKASLMRHLSVEEVNGELLKILTLPAATEIRERTRLALERQWIDPTEYIMDLISKLI